MEVCFGDRDSTFLEFPKKSLKIISLSKKKVNFQNEDETLETNFPLPLYGSVRLNDQL